MSAGLFKVPLLNISFHAVCHVAVCEQKLSAKLGRAQAQILTQHALATACRASAVSNNTVTHLLHGLEAVSFCYEIRACLKVDSFIWGES